MSVTYTVQIGASIGTLVTRDILPGWSKAASTVGRTRITCRFNSLDASDRVNIGDIFLIEENIPVVSSSVANPTVITTSVPHGFVTGQLGGIGGHVGATPDLNAYHSVTVISPTTFSVPVNVTVAGSGGVVSRRIVAGNVETTRERGLGGLGKWDAISVDVEIADFKSYAERRYVKTVLASGSLLSQLTTLLANYLPTSLVTMHPSQDTGPTLAELPCDYVLLRDVLDTLAQSCPTPREWEIDEHWRLRMFEPGSEDAPFNLADGDGNAIGDIEVQLTRQQYANRVIARFNAVAVSAYAFLSASANFGNGETVTVGSKTYTFQTVLTNVDGNVLIGASAADSLDNLIAAINLAGGAGTTYAAATTANSTVSAVSQSASMLRATALAAGASGNSITCTETAANASWITEGGGGTSTLLFGSDQELTNVAIAEDTGAQADPTGVWEWVQAIDTTSYTVALAAAEAILAQRLLVPQRVNYTTYGLGLRPGQTQSIAIARRDLSNTFRLEDVRSSHVANSSLIRHDVAAVESLVPKSTPNWRDAVRAAFGGGSSGSGAASVISVSTGGGGMAGSGTAGKIAKFINAATLGDSILTESGSTVTVAGTLAATTFSGSGASLTAIPAGQLSGTIASSVQDNITRTGTLVSGATGAGFTIALTTSTVTGNLPYARMPSGSGTWSATPTIAGTLTTQSIVPSLTDTYDLGSSSLLWRNGYLSQLTAVLFAKETQTLYGGWLSVQKNAGVFAAAVAVGATTVDFGQSMTANQFVVMRGYDSGGSIRTEYMKVVSLSSGTVYNVERDKANSNPTNQGWSWPMGTPYAVRGVSGDGWIELNAYDTPRMSVFTQGSAYNNSTENVRIGHLTGMPNSSSGIGVYMGDASNYFRYDSSTLRLVSADLTIDSTGLALGSTTAYSGFTNNSALRFRRSTLNQFEQTGDRYGAYAISNGTDQTLYLQNTIVGNTTSNGKALVVVGATGWDSTGGGSATTAASITVRSEVGVSAVSITASSMSISSGLAERGRGTLMGEWTTPAYSGGDFTASGSMTWTVSSGDRETLAYTLVGKTMTIAWRLIGTTVGGTPSTELRIAIPGGFTAAKQMENVHTYSDNGTTGTGVVEVISGGTVIVLFKAAFANWSASTDNTYSIGQITFEVQ